MLNLFLPASSSPRRVLRPRARLSLVTDFGALEKLRPPWETLLQSSASAEPMLGPDWLLTWYSVYGRGRDLRVGLFHEGGELIGMAPLIARRFWYRPGIPFRRLEFLGSDVDEGDGVCSEYLNLIARAGAEEQVADSFAEELAAGAFGDWDELVLPALDGLGRMPDLLVAALRRAGLDATCSTTGEAPYIPLPQSWDEYLSSRPKKSRHWIRQAQRNFQTWCGAQPRLERVADASDLDRGQEILVRLHNQRWSASDRDGGAFRAERFARFHNALMPLLFAKRQVELMWLSVQGEPVAAMYSIVANRKVYFYQTGRKLDVPHGQRPGIALLALAIRKAIEDGQREFDFLGGAAMYKSHLARAARPLVQVRAVCPGWRETARRWAGYGKSALRFLRA